MTKRTPMPATPESQKTDLPLEVEQEITRLSRTKRGEFHMDELVAGLQDFLRDRTRLVDDLDPGGPPPEGAGYEARLAEVSRLAVAAWEQAYSLTFEDMLYLPTPPWIRGLDALFEAAMEAPEDEAARHAVNRCIEAEVERSGMTGEQVLELYRRWLERRQELRNRIFAYETDVYHLIQDAWLRHPKGDKAVLREVFASGLVDVGAMRDALRRHGLAPAPGSSSLWPGKWMLAEDAPEPGEGED